MDLLPTQQSANCSFHPCTAAPNGLKIYTIKHNSTAVCVCVCVCVCVRGCVCLCLNSLETAGRTSMKLDHLFKASVIKGFAAS